MEKENEDGSIGGGIIAGKTMDDYLIYQGGEIKNLGDGKVGGYLVTFSDENSPDLVGDFFTKNTNFGEATTSPVWFNHRLPLETKNGQQVVVRERIGDSEIKMDEHGVLIEAVLYEREKYEEMLDSLGWSSGTAPHLVDRTPVKKSYHIDSWPLGLDASLTPKHAEPRNKAISLKSLAEQDERFKAFLPKAPEEGAVDANPNAESGTEIKENIQGDDKMSENKEEVKAVPQGATIDEIKGLFDPVIERIEKLEKQPAAKAPAVLTMGRGDDELKSFTAFMKGQGSGNVKEQGQEAFELKASNATDMNIGTDADGGYAVPVGLFDQIIARRDEMSLTSRLGCRLIPGIGTTVNVVVDNEADGEFVSTNEAALFDLDAPALTEKAFTLVKYTKRMLMSYELLEDSPLAIFNFVVDWVGRGMAKTNNGLLLTEAAASGTSLKTFASATAIAQGELETIAYNDALDPYLDDSQSVAWVMKKSVRGEIASLVGDFPQYGMHDNNGRTLLGEDVAFSNSAGATVASAKSVYFGNWNYMGYRESPSLTFIRNPYLRADYGQMAFHWHYRTVYGVLQAEAIGYGEHPSA
jgi:HK97 family phage major capsid protein